MADVWQGELLLRSPLFFPLSPLSAVFERSDWPDCAQLNGGWPQQAAGYRFVDQAGLPDDGLYYEQRVGEQRQIPTRLGNWHDLFNAAIWLLFPQAKRALNRLHCRELAAGGGQRSPARDAATLLDESGLLLAYDPQQLPLAELLQRHDWQELFVARRAAWWRCLQPWLFGHALYEKLLTPHLGMTAKCWLLPVTDDYWRQPMAWRRQHLDHALADWLNADQLQRPRQLPVLPFLGIPGAWPLQDAAFYADAHHFRPARAPAP